VIVVRMSTIMKGANCKWYLQRTIKIQLETFTTCMFGLHSHGVR